MTNKEMNTDLAKKILAIFDRSAERRYARAKQEKKKREKEKKKNPAAPHADSSLPPKGVLGKRNGYAQNGSDYVRSKNGRGVYRDFSHAYLEHIRDLVRNQAEFPGGPPENFDPSATDPMGGKAQQQWPYVWDAHHILPGSAFYYVMPSGKANAKKPCFTYRQLRLILLSDYNVNHGHNIIMLPKENWAVPVHALLQHPSDHPDYTRLVMERMREISDELQKAVDQKKPHEDQAKDLFEKLKDLEEEFWDYIVGLSRMVVAAVTEGQEFVHPHVRYTKEDGERAYEWGRLY